MKTGKRDPLLAERESTHGDFGLQSQLAQMIKRLFASSPNWKIMEDREREAMEMKAVKLARYLCGDHKNPEHLIDDIGYSKLILERLSPAAAEAKSKTARNGPQARRF